MMNDILYVPPIKKRYTLDDAHLQHTCDDIELKQLALNVDSVVPFNHALLDESLLETMSSDNDNHTQDESDDEEKNNDEQENDPYIDGDDRDDGPLPHVDMFDQLDLKAFYKYCSRTPLKQFRGLQRSAFDQWHMIMYKLVDMTRNDTFTDPLMDEKLHHVHDRLNAFYDWYLLDCRGPLMDDSFDCGFNRWMQKHGPSYAHPSPCILHDLYMAFHRFLLRVESHHDWNHSVHLVLLLHHLFLCQDRSMKDRLVEHDITDSCRILTIPTMTLIGDVWCMGHHFNRIPHVQLCWFFTHLSDHLETWLLHPLRRLVELEQATRI